MAGAPGGCGTPGRTVLVVYGTRPEAIKMAPVVAALRSEPSLRTVVCTTGQHRELVEQVHRTFDLRPDVDLDLMTDAQHVDEIAARVLTGMHGVLRDHRPDVLVVHGDTTTAMAAALAGFHAGVGVAHVEAGLRTGDLRRPFPEEANRRIIDGLCEMLFPPTPAARAALLAEGHDPARVVLTGNTVVDALVQVAARLPPEPRRDEVLVTVHRRESHGAPLRGILRAVAAVAGRHPGVRFTVPVHPNPAVGPVVGEVLGGLPGVDLVAPMDYPDLVAALRRCRLVLTDSGGIQEEAPTFGTPVLVLRDVTERPEGIAAGAARLVGTDPGAIVSATSQLLDDPSAWQAMSRAGNPYGDGRAAERIAAVLAGRPFQPFEPPAGAGRRPVGAVSAPVVTPGAP